MQFEFKQSSPKFRSSIAGAIKQMVKKFPQEWLEQIFLLLKNHPLVLMKQRKIITPLQFSWLYYKPNSLDDINFRLVRADTDRRDFVSQLLKNVYFCHGRTSVALI